jgi:general secretion pathway protein A
LYQAFYRLKEQAFRLTPDPAYMYVTAQHREALAALIYSVCTQAGLTVLTGEAGTGKTTVLYTLAELLQKRRFVTALCTNPVLTREELFDFLMLKFGIQCPPSKSRQLAALQEALLRQRAEGRNAVLVVDEAHRLSREGLEEIRLLLNLETPREKLLQIILAGQPELSDTLRRPDLRQLKQRIGCLCKLNPLTVAELKEYIDHRLAQAGLPRQTLFPQAAIQRIYEYTEGIPRLVNTLCDNALRNGFALQAPRVTPALVDDAARDLDLLPPADGPSARVAEIAPPVKESNGHAATAPEIAAPPPASPVPLENYAARQKSLNFFAQLMGRWR